MRGVKLWILDNFDKIKKIIGNPHYETKECMIFNMDCVKALDLLNENIPISENRHIWNSTSENRYITKIKWN